MDEKEKIAIIGEGTNTIVIRSADKISIQNPKSCIFNSLEVIAGEYEFVAVTGCRIILNKNKLKEVNTKKRLETF